MTEDPTPEPRRRRWFVRVLRVAMVAAAVTVVLTLAAAGVVAWQYQEYVVRHPGPHLERSYIMGVVAQETPVYYRDGSSRVGVFFEDEHREFVPWSDLPPEYVVSIVAAEDGSYWGHAGVSPKHIARALLDNLEAGRTVSGGSTLTQQTAKNLYYRPDRSFRSKWEELLNALRLEAHYDKSEILTFYVNQFHVSGNGRGLGIAARYFFNEDVSKLSLAECAFLAGLVKGPGHYDPFLGDPQRQARSRQRANDRTRYVLRRIVQEPAANLVGPWTVTSGGDSARLAQVRAMKAQARKLLDEGFELRFNRGRFRYDSNAVLDEVRRRLSEPPFDDVLRKAGISDPEKAGLRVITTLDADAQREAVYGLWHQLSEVGAWLEGLSAKDFVRADSRGPRHDPFHPPRRHEFRVARVRAHGSQAGKTVLDLDLGGHDCRVDRGGLVRAALAVQRGQKKNRYVKVPGAAVDAFANALSDGSIVWVSVREVPTEGVALCDLEVRPELQGSLVVLEDGQVRAMVGGNDNRNFNRATALRQMGSTWKPLVYHAALELGWRPDDPLDNRKNVFPFSTTFYYPRPDHTPQEVVSMAWAGVNSENLASIWLLYHLTDKLNGEQVRVLAEALDLAKREGESVKDYRTRIQKAGVLPTRSRLKEALFLKARLDSLGGLALLGHPEDELALSSMVYGWGHRSQLAKIERSGGRDRAAKKRALRNSWVYMEPLITTCERQYDSLVRSVEQGQVPLPVLVSELSVMLDADQMRVACGDLPAGYVNPDAEALAPLWADSGGQPLAMPVQTPRGVFDRLSDLFSRPQVEQPVPLRLVDLPDVLVDDRLHLETLFAVRSSLTRRKLLLDAAGRVDLYDPDVLYWHQDFRVLLALRYVSELGSQMGIRSKIQPVLSLPLGASEITLEEATAVYGGITSGKAWSFPGRTWQPGSILGGESVASPAHPSLLIAEIQDVDGRVIYRAQPTARMVTSESSAAQTSHILRNVVLHGTGRRAKQAVMLGGSPVPLGGKTGTTNDFKNAAFLGFAPRFERGAWAADRGFIVGAYVGYDDNRAMSNGRIRLAGASGALPAWNTTIRGMAEAGLLGEPDVAPQEPWELELQGGLVALPVDAKVGLPFEDVESTDTDDPAPADTVVWVPASLPPSNVMHVQFEDMPRLERVAPSTADARKRARRRREALERLQQKPSIWDDI